MTEGNANSELLLQLRSDFLTESRESLERIGQLLTTLAKQPSADLIQVIFRELHTLKGTAGFAGIAAIHQIAHKLEDLFGEVRAHQLAISPALVEAAFAGLQQIERVRENLLQGGSGIVDCAGIIMRLGAIQAGKEPVESASSEKQPLSSSAASRSSEELFESGFNTGNWPVIELLDRNRTSRARSETTMRVDVTALDRLMLLVSELSRQRDQLLERADYFEDGPLFDCAGEIARITEDLQTTINQLRLVPIERLFNRFVAVVRNLAHERNLQVHLESRGGEIMLDRAVLEQMTAPFIHLLRNAIDHGIEPPALRSQLGKPVQGLIQLLAAQSEREVILKISDDGRGIDPAQLREAAVKRGLYREREARNLSDEQLLRLIFTPGFTTLSEITDSSGRGVGMDVALANVCSLGGTIEIDTIPGHGTTFTIRLPIRPILG